MSFNFLNNKLRCMIITVPYTQLGGVASFVENIKNEFSFNVRLFFRGNNPVIKKNKKNYSCGINTVKIYYIIK